VETSFTISLLDQEGNPVPSYSRTYRHTSFSDNKNVDTFEIDECGSGLIQRSELEKSAYLNDDAFCVRCDVTVVKRIFTKAIPVSEVRRGVVKKER
jgi:speckle-type POZ protein